MAEMYGKRGRLQRAAAADRCTCSRARTGSTAATAIVSGLLPIAIGLALADRLRGTSVVTAAFFGEGAAAEGEFHECTQPRGAVAAAGAVRLREQPLRDGHRARAIRRPSPRSTARRAAHRIEAEVVDGMDVLAVAEAAARAVERVRETGAPRFLECMTYRFRAHSMFDPELYRDQAEVERWKQR